MHKKRRREASRDTLAARQGAPQKTAGLIEAVMSRELGASPGRCHPTPKFPGTHAGSDDALLRWGVGGAVFASHLMCSTGQVQP